MIKSLYAIALLPLLIFAAGCENDDVMDPAPAAPQGVYSITGNGQIFVYWNGPYERDIVRYDILRSFDPVDNYEKIGHVEAESNSNLDLIRYEYIDKNVKNGTTYFYAVISVDRAGQESDLSAENVPDTPRPQGEVNLAFAAVDPGNAGFIFALGKTADTSVADIFIDTLFDVPHLMLGSNDIWVQDMGSTPDFDFVDVSPVWDASNNPPLGWSQFNALELLQTHTYCIYFQSSGNYAKVRVTHIANSSASLEWAYQTDTSNPELKPVVPGM